ncbi:DUF2934 domain-containing protein [Devosia rhodophyticola]|uniref:DUF2934 domain-containing protein n=1 Tax=Devosia rhodophyticola TaxID=3026423 RepID=A0ABY7YX04_9HYPH|nr:DUF2934 domain-containing protein [Devosia rhodophyticola]WDR05879.1 DUF2934 domain-containing protein [Devosia rhodophyticola]
MAALTETEIRERAYQLWQQAGSPSDQEKQFWYEAEQELSDGSRQAQILDNVSAPKSPLPSGVLSR